jgi:hydroxyacid-oxoacid transhydrogenase
MISFCFLFCIGVSVALTAPAVFKFTSHACPERHIDAAVAFGVDRARIKSSTAGDILAENLTSFLEELDVPNGLKSIGYDSSLIPELVEGTLPQHRVTKLAPEGEPSREQIATIFENSMRIY